MLDIKKQQKLKGLLPNAQNAPQAPSCIDLAPSITFPLPFFEIFCVEKPSHFLFFPTSTTGVDISSDTSVDWVVVFTVYSKSNTQVYFELSTGETN